MKIVCPQCEFGREIPDDRLPSKTAIATCPRCKYRFKVSATGAVSTEGRAPAAPADGTAGTGVDTSSAVVSPKYGTAHDAAGDDPLPPGAIIPRSPAENGATEASPPSEAPLPSGSSTPAGSGPSKPNHPDFEEQQRLAHEAYRRQAEAMAEQEGGDNFALDNPWDNPQYGYPAAFYQTAMRVMFAAPRFFAGLVPSVSQWRPLAFYLVVGVLQIVIERLWGGVLSSALAPAAGTDPQLQALLQMLSPETSIAMTVLLRSAMITLELFFAAALYHLVFRLFTPQNANFSLVFQVLAYSSAPALLCVVPVAGSIVGFIWGLAGSFVGCRYALRLSLSQTVTSLVPLYILGIPLIFYLVQSIQRVVG
ncbi:MAG: zinc-ribbon domain-containing protein [Desulfovibrionaceae bacterium]